MREGKLFRTSPAQLDEPDSVDMPVTFVRTSAAVENRFYAERLPAEKRGIPPDPGSVGIPPAALNETET